MHSHGHHHDHNHSHAAYQGSINTRAFILGILLNSTFVVIEFLYGYWSNSLALMADAGHNLGDVAGLAISLLAFQMAAKSPNTKYTFGYSKGTILASLANSILLLLAVGSIGYEAVHRLFKPSIAQWQTISLVATIGIFINTLTALLFMRRNELNNRAAFLHMAADAGVSAAVVLGGFLIELTGFYQIDPIISLLICGVIVVGSWRLLKNSMRLSLDGVPHNVDPDKIRKSALEVDGVRDIHHLHIWAMSTTRNALTAHLLIREGLSYDEVHRLKKNVKHAWQHLNIQHATIETETEHHDDCEDCHTAGSFD
jgi:cobalt-zinc-cadmium efflux system protein